MTDQEATLEDTSNVPSEGMPAMEEDRESTTNDDQPRAMIEAVGAEQVLWSVRCDARCIVFS